MKTWHYGINTYHKTASVYVEIVPRHLYYLEKIFEYFCCIRILRWIKFPSFINITDKDDGSVYTLKEWWGDLGGWFHCIIHIPIFDCVYNKGRCKTFSFEIDYFKLKEYIKETNKEYWDRIEKDEKEDEEDKMKEEDTPQ